MTVIILQLAALALLAGLMRGSAPEPAPQEVREPAKPEKKS